MEKVKEFRARVYFLKPEEGGRTMPIVSGYRPVICLAAPDGTGERFDSLVTLEGDKQALPGEERLVRIRFWSPGLPDGALKRDAAFELSELARAVGRGTILEVLPEA